MPTRGICCFQVLVLAAITALLLDQCEAAAAANKDTLTFGDSITGDQTRLSKNGIFKLGFFNLNNAGKWYFGIWYAMVPDQTIAWVANRNKPLPSNSALLNITATGGLLLSYQGSPVWSASKISKRPSSAVIGNDGNWVVLGNENKTEVLWQSFDMPGHTWLPGMKISKTERLTSWKSPSDPSDGPFNLQMNPSGLSSFVLRWNHSVTYWDSGVWTGTLFSNVPEMTQNYIYDFSFVDNGTYKYFTYSVKPDQSVISRFEMHHSGEIRVYMVVDNNWSMFWAQPKDQCDVYGVCGAYGSCNNANVQSCSCVLGFQPKDSKAWNSQDWSGGCVRKTPLNCVQNKPNGTNTDGFTVLTSQSSPANGVVLKKSVNERGCRSSCSSDCSCTAYAVTGNKCTLWFGDLVNLRQQSVNSSLSLRLNPKDLQVLNKDNKRVDSGSGGNNKIAIVGAAVGCVAAIAGICILLVVLCRRKARAQLITKSASGSLAVFSFRDLQVATKNFSDRLGGGGFGSVFKGTLKDNAVIAVKKLEGTSQGEKQFRMEVSTIGTVQHLNLVRLRGFCSEGKNRLLVYEYMPNGSLSSVLFEDEQQNGQPQKALDWKTRYAIAVGTARGMVYLHEQCRECIIHCDIKPENILLDEKFTPRIADFGLAKLLGREFSQVLTTMRGTRGYLAPEWLSGLPITPKADVYSYGMTLLEIISGRRNLSKMTDGDSGKVFYPAWAAADLSSGNVMKVVDKRVQGDADAEEVRKAGIIAMWCIQDDENVRPSMREVLQVLEGVADMPPPPPVPISFQALNHQQPQSLVFFWNHSTVDDHNSSGNTNSPSTLNTSPTSTTLSG